MLANRTNHRGGMVISLIVGCILAAILLSGGAFYLLRVGNKVQVITPILAEVSEGEFVAQVLDQGEVQSSENVEIRCEVSARNGVLNVLRVVPEGTLVTEGDFLVQLDATGFEKELEQQKVIMANAETAKIQAETLVLTAQAELDEYIQGTLVEQTKLIENEIYEAEGLIVTSRQNLTQAEATYEHNKTLAAKGFIVPQTLESAEFAVKNAEIQVRRGENMRDLGLKKIEVLGKITSKRFILQFESNIASAKVALASQTEAYQVEENKLKEILKMMKKCTIVVPSGVSGQVVYAMESSRSGADWILEEGGTARDNQVLIRLPNPKKMEVKALINEQSITQVLPGMLVKIRVDALNNQSLKGIVTKVNQYAEQSGWMSSSVRKYAVYVRILNPPEMLKPGMNASVSIQTQYQEKGLIAPIQTVYGLQDKQFCLVKTGENSWETREVVTSGENSLHVLIKEGLKPGDQLVMNPGAYKEYMDLPEVKADNKIEIPQEEVEQIRLASTRVANTGNADAATGPGAGPGGMQLPASGAAVVKERDKDGDGKLSKDEAGSPYSFFFDQVDTDNDGLLSEAELDASIRQMKQRMASGGGMGGGMGGGNGDGPARPAPPAASTESPASGKGS